MIEARMTDPDPKQVLRYLGYRGQDMQTGIAWQIQKGIRTVGEIAAPRLVWRRLPVWNGEISGLPAKGQEIRDLLMPCREAVVMAATLGTQVEQMLMRLKVTDMADAVILDACASAAAEKVCDCFEEDLGSRIEAEGLFLTCRLCPGYGDFPVGTQTALCRLLDTGRRIGLTVTDSQILIPRKSVTAVYGVAKEPQQPCGSGCGSCSMSARCPYSEDEDRCRE